MKVYVTGQLKKEETGHDGGLIYKINMIKPNSGIMHWKNMALNDNFTKEKAKS